MNTSKLMETMGTLGKDNSIIYTNEEFWEVKSAILKLEAVAKVATTSPSQEEFFRWIERAYVCMVYSRLVARQDGV